MEDETKMIIKNANERQSDDGSEFRDRRRFLRCLGKWSIAVIGGVALSTAIEPTQVFGWVDTSGSWIEGPAADSHANRGASWVDDGSRSWVELHGK